MIRLVLHRRWFTDKSTVGLLDYNDDPAFCYTLEDVAREPGVKVPGETAIPPGEYPFIINYSNTFKRKLPLIQAVPMFEGVRIHNGNNDSHTRGCVLVGLERDHNKVLNSRLALEMLMSRLEKDGGQGTIKIVQNLTIL